MSTLNITAAEAARRAETVRAHSYDIELDLSLEGDVFGSRTTIKFSATPDAVGAETFVDFVSDDVRSVLLNGVELGPAAADGTRVTVGPLQAENTLTVIGAAQYMNTGEGLHRFTDLADGETYLYSQFEVADARRVFAVFEQPDIKATFAFSVTAPDHWTVVSNEATPEPVPATVHGDNYWGGLSTETEGYQVWKFAPTPRIACYITAIIAGPYYVVRDSVQLRDGRNLDLGLFCRASLAQYLDTEELFELTRQGFEFFEKEFNTPYPFSKYDQLFVPEFNAGAMENAGAVTYLESYIFRGPVAQAMVERRAITLLHEMAHMWFGNLVTMRWWNDLWLNEAFAEFISHVAAAENTKYDTAWATFAATEKNWAYRQDQLATTHPIVAEISDLDSVLQNFDGITYAKGASVLKALMAFVGRKNFAAAVEKYFARHAYANTELKDLLGALETESGKDLSQWSKLWLESSGVNVLETEVALEKEHITELTIHQRGELLRPHQIVVGFYGWEAGQLVQQQRFEVEIAGESVVVDQAAGAVMPVLIMVNDEDLSYAKIRLDEASEHTVVGHLSKITDPLTRTVLWGWAWDMVRDGERSTGWFVSLVLAHIGAEDQSSVVFNVLRQVGTALHHYVPTSMIGELTHDTAAGLWKLTQDAEPGSDLQLQLLKAFMMQARGDQLDVVEQLAAPDQQVLQGLEVSADLRWEILTALVAGGRATEADIDQALAKDSTSNGELAAMTARAALPTTTAKAAAWDALTGGELSNMGQRHVIIGFTRVHDLALLAPYVDKYFSHVDQVWGVGSHEMAETFSTGLYPSWAVVEATYNASTQLLERTEHTGLQRVLVESRDDLLRAKKARESF